MAEYIERDEAIKAVANNPYNVAFKTIKTIEEIKSIPTADVDSVVRCCECKHRYIPERCALWYGHYDGKDYYVDRGDNFYCSYGERQNKKMNDKPMIRHCKNCKWLTCMDYCRVKYKYRLDELQRISALLCKYYTERKLEEWEV